MQPGLYVVQRVVGFKSHVGILAVGNLGLLGLGRRPLGQLIHFNQQGLHRDVIYGLDGWKVVRRIADQAGASARLRQFLGTPQQYGVLNNNCEHLVSFVETGERKSSQVRGWATAAALVAGVVILSKSA